MRLHLHQRTGFLEHGDEALAGLEPIKTVDRRRDAAGGVRAFVHDGVLVDDDRRRQLVAAADLEVVGVMGGRDLHDAGSEGRIGIVVGDDGYFDADDGQGDGFADETLVAGGLGIYRDGGVGEHRVRTGGGG